MYIVCAPQTQACIKAEKWQNNLQNGETLLLNEYMKELIFLLQCSFVPLLTDQVMKDCVLVVIFWDGVLGIQYSQLSGVFKGVLHKTQKE